MFLDCRRKPKNPQRTYRDTGEHEASTQSGPQSNESVHIVDIKLSENRKNMAVKGSCETVKFGYSASSCTEIKYMYVFI